MADQITPDSAAVASAAVLMSLLRAMEAKGHLTRNEVRDVLTEGAKNVALITADPNTSGFAEELIAYMMREQFPIR